MRAHPQALLASAFVQCSTFLELITLYSASPDLEVFVPASCKDHQCSVSAEKASMFLSCKVCTALDRKQPQHRGQKAEQSKTSIGVQRSTAQHRAAQRSNRQAMAEQQLKTCLTNREKPVKTKHSMRLSNFQQCLMRVSYPPNSK